MQYLFAVSFAVLLRKASQPLRNDSSYLFRQYSSRQSGGRFELSPIESLDVLHRKTASFIRYSFGKFQLVGIIRFYV